MDESQVRALARAFAAANGHPDSDAYAQAVVDAFKAPPQPAPQPPAPDQTGIPEGGV